MARRLTVNPADAVPIWKQIEDGLRGLVAGGALARGATVPSVRELAKDLRVNPATVAKAYQRLCDAGVLTVKRGEGTFVADSPPQPGKAERQRILREGAERYAGAAMAAGAGLGEASDELDRVWTRWTKEGGRP